MKSIIPFFSPPIHLFRQFFFSVLVFPFARTVLAQGIQLSRPVTTITREIRSRAIESDKGAAYRVTNRCAFKIECQRRDIYTNYPSDTAIKEGFATASHFLPYSVAHYPTERPLEFGMLPKQVERLFEKQLAAALAEGRAEGGESAADGGGAPSLPGVQLTRARVI